MGKIDSPRRRRRQGLTILIALAATLLPAVAAAQTFPPDAAWVALTRLDAGQHTPIGDAAGDAAGARDIVGSADHPMAYVHSDATHVYFRLRINATSLAAATNFIDNTSWGCLIDTNADASQYELSAIVDGTNLPDAVRFWANTVQQTAGSPSDEPEVLVKAYLGPLSTGQPGFGYARQVSAGTIFPTTTPDADFFVD